MVEHHRKVHFPRLDVCTDKAELSVDGVQEGGSTTISLLVFSLRFAGCRLIHTIAIVRPEEKVKVDHLLVLRKVVDDLK